MVALGRYKDISYNDTTYEETCIVTIHIAILVIVTLDIGTNSSYSDTNHNNTIIGTLDIVMLV